MLGETVKRLRIARGLSQQELARCAHISVSFLSLLERGKREPTLSVLRRIAAALGSPFGLLLASGLITDEPTSGQQEAQVSAIVALVEAVRLQFLAEHAGRKQFPLPLDS